MHFKGMSFHVNLTESAVRDVVGILTWLNERSNSGADAWFQKWLEALRILEDRGGDLAVAPESPARDEIIRQVLFRTKHGRTYRALYCVRADEIFVLHVRGPGQQLIKPGDLVLPTDE